VTGQFVSSGDDIAGDGKTTLKLEDLSIDFVGLNNGVFDTVKNWANVDIVQSASNLKDEKIIFNCHCI
jgi:hypothetical protein